MAIKLLVVDDDPDIVEMMTRKLVKEGYDVVQAFDGEEALLKVKQDNPDVILLDLMMPKMNGFEVLKEIREKHNDRWRPVIIISANTDIAAINKSYGLEADHYLTKPCKLENVLSGIRTMVSLIPLRIHEGKK